MFDKTWDTPKSRSLGRFTDLKLFYEALELAVERGEITYQLLEEELPQRLQGLFFVEKQSAAAARDLIRELRDFYWITPATGAHRRALDDSAYMPTEKGQHALNLYREHKNREALRALMTEMQKVYTIPAWFVHRLWQINPKRQGEVVIPAPLRDWNTKSRNWEDNQWTAELTVQTKRSLQVIGEVCPGALPISEEKWEQLVKTAWRRLSDLNPKAVLTNPKDVGLGETSRGITYAPRRRLAWAMREAAVKHLFGNARPNSLREDFGRSAPPIAPRTYMGWCPRLESLELIFYTDAHPLIPGRLIFPTSVFRTSASLDRFEKLDYIAEPEGKFLWLHRPKWELIRDEFHKILYQEHKQVSNRVKSLYVSLLDVRDEVCRQLRVSAACFDEYLEEALIESVLPNSPWSISVETDIREDQRAAPQLYRRPIWINGTAHSLIAMTETSQPQV